MNHLAECQRFVLERVNFLEIKRKEVLQRIQNLGLSSYRDTLENKILEMKMIVTVNVDKKANIDKVTHVTDRKCRYNNTGYCKMNQECKFLHSEIICEQFLLDGHCSLSSAQIKKKDLKYILKIVNTG